jgi:hypothetical protein
VKYVAGFIRQLEDIAGPIDQHHGAERHDETSASKESAFGGLIQRPTSPNPHLLLGGQDDDRVSRHDRLPSTG